MEDKKVAHDPDDDIIEHSTANCVRCGTSFPVTLGIHHLNQVCPSCGGSNLYYPKKAPPQRD